MLLWKPMVWGSSILGHPRGDVWGRYVNICEWDATTGGLPRVEGMPTAFGDHLCHWRSHQEIGLEPDGVSRHIFGYIYIYSDILPSILSDIHFDSLSAIQSGILSSIYSAFYLSSILAFYLAFYLTSILFYVDIDILSAIHSGIIFYLDLSI